MLELLLSLSTYHLVILAALVERNADNTSGNTYVPGDWFGTLGNVIDHLRKTNPWFTLLSEEELYWMVMCRHRLASFMHYVEDPQDHASDFLCLPEYEPGYVYSNLQYSVKPEMYALKDALLAWAEARVACEGGA